MKRHLLRNCAFTLAASALTLGVAAANADAATIRPDLSRLTCNNSNYTEVWNYNYTGELCFGGDGSQSVAIYDTDAVLPGNNSGGGLYTDTQVCADYSFGDDYGYYWSASLDSELNTIDITGQW
jgi:hypothetical protein